MANQYYFIKPFQSQKFHITGEDGRSLCSKWLMTNKEDPIKKGSKIKIGKKDCKTCFKHFLKNNPDYEEGGS